MKLKLYQAFDEVDGKWHSSLLYENKNEFLKYYNNDEFKEVTLIEAIRNRKILYKEFFNIEIIRSKNENT